MTRGVVSHGVLRRAWGGSHSCGSQLLAHVAHSLAEPRGSRGKLFICRKEMCVSRQHRATATGIGNDWGIRVKSLDVLSRQLACAFEISRMSVQRATANLLGGRADVQVIGAQDTLGGTIDACE